MLGKQGSVAAWAATRNWVRDRLEGEQSGSGPRLPGALTPAASSPSGLWQAWLWNWLCRPPSTSLCSACFSGVIPSTFKLGGGGGPLLPGGIACSSFFILMTLGFHWHIKNADAVTSIAHPNVHTVDFATEKLLHNRGPSESDCPSQCPKTHFSLSISDFDGILSCWCLSTNLHSNLQGTFTDDNFQSSS